VAPLPEARSSHDTVGVGLDMYVLGGVLQSRRTTTTLKFASTQGTWSEVAPMSERIDSFAACAVGSDVYVFGRDMIDDTRLTCFKYDTVANTWSTRMPRPARCRPGNSASLLDGLV
jgi:hypothetical protein